MKRTSSLLTATAASVLLLAGSAMAQDATTRGGAKSAEPSTRQNSPATGAMTAPGANTNTTGSATSGAAMDKSDGMTKDKMDSKAKQKQQ